MKKQSRVRASSSTWELSKSTQPGIARELERYGITSFDPRDVQVNTEKRTFWARSGAGPRYFATRHMLATLQKRVQP